MENKKLTQVDVISAYKQLDGNGDIVSLTEKEEQRIARLQKYVEMVEQAYRVLGEKKRNGELTGFSEEEIRFHLSHDPDMISEAGLMLAKFQRSYEYAKVDTQIILSQLWKKCNEKKESLGLTNAKDRESWVKTQTEYVVAIRQEIEWKYQLNRMQIIYDRYQNLFVGSRKIASMLMQDKANYDQGI